MTDFSVHDADPGVHDADPSVHDGPIWVFTMRRSGRSRWSDFRTWCATSRRPSARTSPTRRRSAGRRIFKILLQRRDVTMPRDRDLVAQIHAIKRRVLPSGKVSFDAERNARGHADKFWAVALACQRERQADKPRTGEIGVRVLG
jgi:hypothetical protein